MQLVEILGWVFTDHVSKWSPRSKFYCLHQIPLTNIIFLATNIFHEFYNSSLTFVNALPHFLICGFRYFCVFSTFILIPLPTWIIFPGFLLLFLQTLQKNSLVTFHAFGCSNLTIMVDNWRKIVVYKHCLCTMFAF